jgi:hypothetical protein
MKSSAMLNSKKSVYALNSKELALNKSNLKQKHAKSRTNRPSKHNRSACKKLIVKNKTSRVLLDSGLSGDLLFMKKMMDLMASLDYLRAYIDDLLIITRGTIEDHISKIETVLTRLRDTRLKVNSAKSFFCTHEIEYLGGGG